MKLDARRLPGFLRDPGSCRLVLLFGEDDGLIRERSHAITRSITGGITDPFRVAEITREGWSQIAPEIAALSMTGGRRVVVVHDVTDAILPLVVEAMKGVGDGLLILEAAGLGKGKLRSFCESTANTVAIACYAEEGKELADVIGSIMSDAGVTTDLETVNWLSHTIGGDRALVRAEVEKIILMAGPDQRIGLELARSCVGEVATISADNGLLAATLGNVTAADEGVEAATANGFTGVALIRLAIIHLQRLHQTKMRIADGMSAADAVRLLRPPVFYKLMPGTIAALSIWSTSTLWRALIAARDVELACKQTGSRPELLAKHFVLDLARSVNARKGVNFG